MSDKLILCRLSALLALLALPSGSFAQECSDWKAKHPTWFWCDDFETETDLRKNYQDVGLTGFGVSNVDKYQGQQALRQHYDQGQVNAGWIFRMFGDALGKDYGQNHVEIHARWYHKFETGFEGAPPKMARLSSLGPGFEKRGAVHYWVSEDRDLRIVADVKAPESGQANAAGYLPIAKSDFYYSRAENIGRWTCHEMQVRINTKGTADGLYRFWVDGRMLVEKLNVDLRGSTDNHFNAFQLDAYWNGGSPRAQNRYFDNFVLATGRIGCLDPSSSIQAPAGPMGRARISPMEGIFAWSRLLPSGTAGASLVDARGRTLMNVVVP